jgi:hypothetical protein
MRIIFFLLFVLPLMAVGQDCKLNRDTDSFTKEVRLSTGFLELDNASLTIDADSREIDLFFTLSGADKCFDNNSTASVYFEGTKSKLNIRNGGTMNCEGFFHFIYKNAASDNSVLKRLLAQKMTHIVFTGNNKKETTLTFTPEDQELILKFANCLVKEAKTLLK